MRPLTIGVRGHGVSISFGSSPNFRLITPVRARRYAKLLIEAAAAAEVVERRPPLPIDELQPEDILPAKEVG